MTITSMDEQILRASKEIIVKFIEVGKISPTSFAGAFKDIYSAIDETVKGAAIESLSAIAAETPPSKGKEKKK
jgi:hypothetical protein